MTEGVDGLSRDKRKPGKQPLAEGMALCPRRVPARGPTCMGTCRCDRHMISAVPQPSAVARMNTCLCGAL